MIDITPYQIDYQVKNVGRTVAHTKKKIRFRFGFANNEAISTGSNGVDCRGMEHTITLTWSFATGKTIVECDMKEIHFSMGSTSKFQFAWPFKTDIMCEIIGHAAPCSSKQGAPPNWKQFDLLINGMSYFDIPKIYELGIVCFPGLEAMPSPFGRVSPNQSPPRSLSSQWGAPVPTSMRVQAPPSPPRTIREANLLEFGSGSSTTTTPSATLSGSQDQQQQVYGAPSSPDFASYPAQPSAQENCVAADPLTTLPPFEQQSFASSAVPAFATATEPTAPKSEVVVLPTSQPAVEQNEKRNPGSMSGAERAVSDLVNLNDITSSPFLQAGKLTMMSPDNMAIKPTLNNDKPLSELKSSSGPKKSVMNTFRPAPSMQQQPQGMYAHQRGFLGQQQSQGMYGGLVPPPINNMGVGDFPQKQRPQQSGYSNYQL